MTATPLSHTVALYIFTFLQPRYQWTLRSVCRLFRDAADAAEPFYPFVVLRVDLPTLVGTFCFSEQEVLAVTYTRPLVQRVTYGKARNVAYDDLAGYIDDIVNAILVDLPWVIDPLVPGFGDAPPLPHLVLPSCSSSCAGRAETTCSRAYRCGYSAHRDALHRTSVMLHVLSDDSHRPVVNALKQRLSECVFPVPVFIVQLKLDDILGKSAAAFRLRRLYGEDDDDGEGDALPARRIWMTTLEGSDTRATVAGIQRAVHWSFMSELSAPLGGVVGENRVVDAGGEGGEDCAAAVPSVPGYNCYYGRGARRFTYAEARALFGQTQTQRDMAEPFSRFRTPNSNSRAALPASPPSAFQHIPWLASSFSVRLYEVVGDCFLRTEMAHKDFLHGAVIVARDQTLLFSERHLDARHWREENAFLHVGSTPQDLEAVVSWGDIARGSQEHWYSFPQSQNLRDDLLLLYVTDNTFYAERFDEMLRPTRWLNEEWSAKVQRNTAAEDAAPHIHGRPLTTPWILWGPAGTSSSAHREPSASCVWVHLIRGTKRWFIFQEERNQWEMFVQREGETVIVGSKILHAVLNEGVDNFAIACNFVPM